MQSRDASESTAEPQRHQLQLSGDENQPFCPSSHAWLRAIISASRHRLCPEEWVIWDTRKKSKRNACKRCAEIDGKGFGVLHSSSIGGALSPSFLPTTGYILKRSENL